MNKEIEILKFKRHVQCLLQREFKIDIKIDEISLFNFHINKKNYNFKYKGKKYLIKEHLFHNIIDNNQSHIMKHYKTFNIDIEQYLEHNINCAIDIMKIFEYKELFNSFFKYFPKILNVYTELIEVEYFDEFNILSYDEFFDNYKILSSMYDPINIVIPLEISRENIISVDGIIKFIDFDDLTINHKFIQDFIYSVDDNIFTFKGDKLKVRLVFEDNYDKKYSIKQYGESNEL